MSECQRNSSCRCSDCTAAMSAFSLSDLKSITSSSFGEENEVPKKQAPNSALSTKTKLNSPVKTPTRKITAVAEVRNDPIFEETNEMDVEIEDTIEELPVVDPVVRYSSEKPPRSPAIALDGRSFSDRPNAPSNSQRTSLKKTLSLPERGMKSSTKGAQSTPKNGGIALTSVRSKSPLDSIVRQNSEFSSFPVVEEADTIPKELESYSICSSNKSEKFSALPKELQLPYDEHKQEADELFHLQSKSSPVSDITPQSQSTMDSIVKYEENSDTGFEGDMHDDILMDDILVEVCSNNSEKVSLKNSMTLHIVGKSPSLPEIIIPQEEDLFPEVTTPAKITKKTPKSTPLPRVAMLSRSNSALRPKFNGTPSAKDFATRASSAPPSTVNNKTPTAAQHVPFKSSSTNGKVSEITPIKLLNNRSKSTISPTQKIIPSSSKGAPEIIQGRRKMRVGTGLSSTFDKNDKSVKFSQYELDAAISAKIAALTELHDKAIQKENRKGETRITELEAAIRSAQSELEDTKIRQEQKEKRMVQQLHELEQSYSARLAALEKCTAEKALHIDLVSNQLRDMTRQEEELKKLHLEEIAKKEAEEIELKAQLAQKDETLKKLQAEFMIFQEAERDKRVKAVLQMKDEMTKLAKEKFNVANEHYFYAKSLLETKSKELEENRTETEEALAEQEKIKEEISKAVNSAKSANSMVAAAESVLANREKEKLEDLRELRQRSIELSAQLLEATKIKDAAISETQALQSSLAAYAHRERMLIRDNTELKEVSEQLLALMEQNENVTHTAQ